jgi:bacillithiol system protein YtxJ
MKWNSLTSIEQIDQIKEESKQVPVVIFKHSTRCNISRTSLDRLERNWKDNDAPHVKLYFLDLLSYREISNRIADEFGVYHESPQVMVIKNEKATFDRSHFDIDYQQILKEIKS